MEERNSCKVSFYRCIKELRRKYFPFKEGKYNKVLLRGYFLKKTLNIRRTGKICWLLATPEHGNTGDQAIAYAEKLYLDQYLSNFQIEEIPIISVCRNFEWLKNSIRNDDVIILHGGGNLGNIYYSEEVMRRLIIQNFPNNNIVLFPQTMHFTDDVVGRQELALSAKIYSAHKKLFLFAREKTSYKMMKENFGNTVYLVPDIVFSLAMHINNKTHLQNEAVMGGGRGFLLTRKGCMLCLRNDGEGHITDDNIQKLTSKLANIYDGIEISDTVIHHIKGNIDREQKLQAMWSKFSSKELVVTNRLHGMIFSVLTRTPCVVLPNFNHKITDSYEWVKELGGVRFFDNIESFFECDLDEIKNLKYCVSPNSILNKFKPLEDVLHQLNGEGNS